MDTTCDVPVAEHEGRVRPYACGPRCETHRPRPIPPEPTYVGGAAAGRDRRAVQVALDKAVREREEAQRRTRLARRGGR